MENRTLSLYQVDAFAGAAFGGNPAAVCLLPSWSLPLSDATRQQIAAEMNLSETAFLECLDGSDDFKACTHFRLRWFTPVLEVPLCGHATLAAAAALFQGEGSKSSLLRFATQSGELTVKLERTPSEDGSAGEGNVGHAAEPPLLCMDFPLVPTSEPLPEGMEAGSQLVEAVVGDLPVEQVQYAPSLRYLMVVLRDQGPATYKAFLSLRPNAQRMEAAHRDSMLVGVIVTLQGGGASPHDFYSRFFAPWAGITEDPVTGSAHCVLGPYWAQRLGKTSMAARQCSGRVGELRVRVDREQGRVEVAGQGVLVVRGQLLLPPACS